MCDYATPIRPIPQEDRVPAKTKRPQLKGYELQSVPKRSALGGRSGVSVDQCPTQGQDRRAPVQGQDDPAAANRSSRAIVAPAGGVRTRTAFAVSEKPNVRP